MCRYTYDTYICGHTLKLSQAYTCDGLRDCTINNTILLEFNEDIATVRRCIADFKLERTNTPEYLTRLDQLEANFPTYFGHGSGNKRRPLDSFRQIEEHLAGEYARFPANQPARLLPARQNNVVCMNGCWEGIVYNQRREREEAERRARESVARTEQHRDREIAEGRRNPGYGLYNGGANGNRYDGNGGGYLGYGANPWGNGGNRGGNGYNGGRH